GLAADPVELLGEHHARALPGGGQGGGHTTQAGSHDQDLGVGVHSGHTWGLSLVLGWGSPVAGGAMVSPATSSPGMGTCSAPAGSTASSDERLGAAAAAPAPAGAVVAARPCCEPS